MPVEFLSDTEAGAYGRFSGAPSRVELERVFFLDDADRALVDRRRGAHNRLGFALRLTTVRSLGMFLADPLGVPQAVVDYLGGHADEIKRAFGLQDFAAAEEDLERWVDARAWTTGDGPRAIFDDAVVWLFERRVVARRRAAGDSAAQRDRRRRRRAR